jgi:2-C-methyl-D-erythritol 4-phosphate cytidylyltransferase
LSADITSTNPVVQAIISGKAPQPARLAAARGLLPLPQNDLLEVLVALTTSEDAQIAAAATETLKAETAEDLLSAASDDETAPKVLAYLATRDGGTPQLYEATILNTRTPAHALAKLAATTPHASLLELITINQQRLVRAPEIIEAILSNPACGGDAERRARETRKEFFEKERGARQIADELRARGQTAAAEFFETAELTTVAGELSVEDVWLIAQHIEVSDADLDDSWLPAERYEELSESAAEIAANAQRVIETERMESGDVSTERVSLIRRIMFMNTKDRMRLAMKGDREARGILIRDSNKIVCSAVVKNPRITEHEIENIAGMRTVADEVLRIIALNRSWIRSYVIIHNLARNPRTPIPTAMNILPRIRTKDLQQLAQNRNVSEAVRRHAYRLGQTRSGQ